ncbi:MAG: type IV toxin-antitoxin system AbiEi family antitoxin domain-containing protein [Acidimicrobiales bacterium]
MDAEARAALNQLACEQRGVFSVAQAKRIGVSNAQLTRAQLRGELRRLRRGVYAMAGPASAWDELMAAVVLAGEGAVLSHSSAAAVHRFEYGLERVGAAVVELTFVTGRRSRLPGALVHHVQDLASEDIVTKRCVLVTSRCRTLVDLAGRLGPALTEKTLDEGIIQRRWTAREVQDCLRRARPNVPGRGGLEQLLALRLEGPTADSALEARAYGALVPFMPYSAHFRVTIGGCDYVLDAAWPEYRVCAEIVGRSHRLASRSAFDRERRKLNALAGAGWRVAHLTHTMSSAEMVAAVETLLPGRLARLAELPARVPVSRAAPWARAALPGR